MLPFFSEASSFFNTSDSVAQTSISALTNDAELIHQYSEEDHSLFGSHELPLPKRAIETYVGHVDSDTSGKWPS